MKKIALACVFLTMLIVFSACGSQSQDYTSPNIGVLKHVPAGIFQRDGHAANLSSISEFRMSRHEITRAQFKAIMGDDPADVYESSGTNDPVQMINWYHAVTFCNKLSLAEKLTPVYQVSGVDFKTISFSDIPTSSSSDWNNVTCDWSADGYRLPTEMEWMWAAMGAQNDRYKYFSDDGLEVLIDDFAWHKGNSRTENGQKTHPVGMKQANELGLFDLFGNVSEWCWDWHEAPFPEGNLTDYRGAEAGEYRVAQGGSFSSIPLDMTILRRFTSSEPSNQSVETGFRVVRR